MEVAQTNIQLYNQLTASEEGVPGFKRRKKGTALSRLVRQISKK